MRTALLATALMMTAALAWGDEPSAADAKQEATTEAAPAKPAEQAAAAEQTTAAIATQEEKPFKPPTGYRPKRINGEQVYCTKMVVLGSRFPKEDCRTESQLRDLEQQKASMRGEMDQRNHVCSGTEACQSF